MKVLRNGSKTRRRSGGSREWAFIVAAAIRACRRSYNGKLRLARRITSFRGGMKVRRDGSKTRRRSGGSREGAFIAAAAIRACRRSYNGALRLALRITSFREDEGSARPQ